MNKDQDRCRIVSRAPERDVLCIAEAKWIEDAENVSMYETRDPAQKIDAAVLLQNNTTGTFDPQLPYVVIPQTHIRFVITGLRNYLRNRTT